MAVYKCKACGASLDVSEGQSVVVCDYCDVKQAVPKVQDENLQGLFNRANTLRIKCEFDKAEKLYEKIVEADSTQAEAYWGLILCRYGIEYVEDKRTFRRLPTCHRASFESIIADADYKAALMNADSVQRAVYEADAREIDRIQKEILAISGKEEPYDVFICYKQSDDTGRRTVDSALGNEIYHQLTQEGYKVFFAAITLEDKLGSAYEPIIFAALNTSKVMLALGTKPEYFNAVWVKNEWSRFMKLMKNDRSKMLIPCYKDMDAYELPDELSNLQALDMSSIAFIPDLVRNIKKIIVKDKAPVAVSYSAPVQQAAVGANISPLLRRAYMYLEDGDFASADEYCEKVLDQDPENAKAYLYKLLAELKLTSVEKLATVKGQTEISEDKNDIVIKRIYGENKLSIIKIIRAISGWGLKEAKDFVDAPNSNLKFSVTAAEAKELMSLGVSLDVVKVTSAGASIEKIESSGNYKKFMRFASEAEKAEVLKLVDDAKNATMYEARKAQYDEAASLYRRAIKEADFLKAADTFECLGNFEDAKERAKLCREKAEVAAKEEIYASAKANISSRDPRRMEKAYDDLEKILDYKDAYELRASIPALIEKVKADREEAKLNSEYANAVALSEKNNLESVYSAITAFEALGNYKDSIERIETAKARIAELEKNLEDEAVNEHLEAEYKKAYPILSRETEINNKHAEAVRAFNTFNTKRNNDKSATLGCSVAALIFTILGICLVLYGISEDSTFMTIIGVANAILMPVGLYYVLKSNKETKDSLADARFNLEVAEKNLKELKAVPPMETYCADRKNQLTAKEKEKICADYKASLSSKGSKNSGNPVNNKSNNAPAGSVVCRACGGMNRIVNGNVNAKCVYCKSKLTF